MGLRQTARFPWHPALFSLAPVAALAAETIEPLPARYIWRPALAVVACSVALSLVLWRVLRDRHKAAALASMACAFTLYTPLNALLLADPPPETPAWALRTLGLALTALFLTLFAVVTRSRWRLASLTPWANLTGLAILALPLADIIHFELVQARRPLPPVPAAESPVGADPQRPLPDIYFVVLDGYGRADLLETRYGYDNSSFVEFLRSRGFHVADASLSNYSQTTLSLASTLNLTYLDFLPAELGRCSQDQNPLDGLIGSSLVQSSLRAMGYETYAFATEYRRSEIESADRFLIPPLRAATPFEALLFDRSALSILGYRRLIPGVPPLFPGYAAHGDMLAFGFEELARLASVPGPKFVFAHLVIPHPPFVFLEDGRPRTPERPYLLRDGNETGMTTAEYVEGYTSQLAYLNTVLRTLVVAIQTGSSTPPIIILQGDHGPGSRLNWDVPRLSDTWERHAILNAIYLGGERDPALDDELTPVNTFRIVFNHAFGTAYPILENRSYFSTWRWPYDFQAAAATPDAEPAEELTAPACPPDGE